MKPILIVDDEAPIRALIRLTLKRAGYTCDEAATGTEAADKIEANTYDLALLDIMLPGPDGYELLDYLRDFFDRQNRGGGPCAWAAPRRG